NKRIPQLWIVFVPDGLSSCEPLSVHVFFGPAPREEQAASPYPYGSEWCKRANNYLTNIGKKLLHQRAASTKKCLFVFPLPRPYTTKKEDPAAIYGDLKQATELRRHLRQLVCWLSLRINVDLTITQCTISGFSDAGEHALLPIMNSSRRNEFPELMEVYALDAVNKNTEGGPGVSEFAHAVQRWVSGRASRIVRMYTSIPRVAADGMRPELFSGPPTRTNAEAKEWHVAQGTFVYTPPEFWNRIFEGQEEKNQYIYKHPFPHQLMPCVFLQHALQNSSVPRSHTHRYRHHNRRRYPAKRNLAF
ncbi:MAG: hypothetical protein WCA35_03375, partial [Kovacikia sp.]